MSEIREEILFTADDDFWGSWIENREMLAQAEDSELAKHFWDERPNGHVKKSDCCIDWLGGWARRRDKRFSVRPIVRPRVSTMKDS